MKALFLSHQHALSAGGGGQQQCTREYRETLCAAGFELHDVTFDTDRSWLTRLRRKFDPAPYANLIPSDYFPRVMAAVEEHLPTFVFCNLYNFIPYGLQLRRKLPVATKLVLLSHGLASVDEIHAARIACQFSAAKHLPKINDRWIGNMLRVECEGLAAFDHVFCLALFEVEICRWLGSRSVSWWPRTVRMDRFLPWKPAGDRVGIIGTIDHPPNFEGATLFCDALKAIGPGRMRVRIVSHSRAVVADLASRYDFVDDLGPMKNPAEAEAEAATWSAFLHPIFCHAMGCSTKVATGLNWGLPVLTSAAGMRGYAWKSGELSVYNTPAELARAALAILDPSRANALHEEIVKVVRSAPTLTEVAAQFRRNLGLA